MEFYNEMTIKFNKEVELETVKKAIFNSIKNSKLNDEYAFNAPQSLIDNLTQKDNEITLPEYFCCYIPEDADELFEDMMLAIACFYKGYEFTCELYNNSTYSESCCDATYKNGSLELECTYYPSGHCEMLICEECGEEIVSIEDYNPDETYTCPECGEVLDLQKQYDETAPKIEKKVIEIN